ncbi:LLM class flavin-dependent oxidoreductase [Salinactinospora qingdaonensis]|uniref:LLM class flavin-dependent oxidoreductase n=1 Tax=Salinactinospora qingdaonensis TaxID=702744 RepID=A0ABP7FA53_9ACTN
MPLALHWFLPSHGDGRHVDARKSNTAGPRRAPDLNYLAQVARAADGAGFAGVLTPAGLFCEDPWLLASALARETRRLRFMVAFRPGLMSPTLAAQMSATCQRISDGRLLLNVVTGGDPEEQRRYGDWLDHDQRYARTDEFLAVMRGVWSGDATTFEGEHLRVERALLTRPPEPPPPIFLGGSSTSAKETAARHADVYLAWGEPPPQLAEHVEKARQMAAEQGRTLSFGTRFHVISRDTSEEAWGEAERLIEGMDPELIAATQRRLGRSDSEGQRRMAALHGGSTDGLEVYPNVWAGYGLVRQGAGTALVGSHEEVADRLAEYYRLGIEHVILSGQPHLEEAHWIGEGVLPLLRERGLLAE